MNLSTETALFALGNFWEPEYQFSKLEGVLETEVGYTGGTSNHPTYHAIGDHSEAVQIEFDPRQLTYEQLLDVFWSLHDPTADYETKFRSAIFYFDERQRTLAEESKENQQTHHAQPITTEILAAGKFYPAEGYHQHYFARLQGEL